MENIDLKFENIDFDIKFKNPQGLEPRQTLKTHTGKVDFDFESIDFDFENIDFEFGNIDP